MYVQLIRHGGRSAAIVLAVGLALGASACSTHRPARADSSLTAAALDMVTESGQWSISERVLNQADDQLVSQCMHAAGLQYRGGENTVTDNGNAASVVDMARRRSDGYGLGPGVKTDPSAQDAYVASLDAATRQRYLTTLFGPDSAYVKVDLPGGGQASLPGAGCEADAVRRLSPDLSSWGRIEYVPQQLGNQLADEVPHDAGYQSAMGHWSSCMATAGFHYTSPEQAVTALQADYKSDGSTPATQQRERAVAVADGHCALAAQVPQAALAARRTIAATLPPADRAELNQLATIRQTMVNQARMVLAGS